MRGIAIKQFEAQSRAMLVLRKFGFHSLAWSLRRLHVPVPKSALVLEVGSGGNPYFRSNVLIDAYEETRQRHYVPLVSDRPTVLGYAENLPFKDKAFDFVIASHVLEHSSDPDRFLCELERVAKAGYIEVPDALMERLNPYSDHRLEITVRKNRLIIRKKTATQVDPELVELYGNRANTIIAGKSIPSFPFEFHVRYYFSDRIEREIVNPEDDASWPAPEFNHQVSSRKISLRATFQSIVLQQIRRFFSQNRRNRNLNIATLLRCPTCKDGSIYMNSVSAVCKACSTSYQVTNGIPKLFSLEVEGVKRSRMEA
jgi:SAM-dependent methyltransferase